MGSGKKINETDLTITCRDGFAMPAALFELDARDIRPGLLFVGEPFGLNPEMRRVCTEVAGWGYTVIAPDFVSRGNWLRCVRALIRNLKSGIGQGTEDLLDVRAWLAKRPGVDGSRIAVMGLCMGGGFALLLAKTGLFRVSAPFYGQTPGALDGACPIVASFGDRDAMIRPHAEALQREVNRLGIPHDIKSYPRAGHSFLTRAPNRLMGLIGPILPPHTGYVPEAATDAMQRVRTFLLEHLG